MSQLKITYHNQSFVLEPGDQFTFGRDASCTVCLDPTDTGISRRAGSISYDGGIWWIFNRSMKRTIHVVGDAGVTVPVPVATPSEHSSRAVDQTKLCVMVVGSVYRHAIYLSAPAIAAPGTISAPSNQVTTVSPHVKMTVGQREALVAMVSGYLRPYPRYDPHPLTYQEVVDMLGNGVTKKAVINRVAAFKEHLLENVDVSGLTGTDDARRRLAEWILFTRLVGANDLIWLEERLRQPTTVGL